MDALVESLDHTWVWKNSLMTWGYAIFAGVIAYVLVQGLILIFRGQLKKRVSAVRVTITGLILAFLRATKGTLLFILALLTACLTLELPGNVATIFKGILFAVVAIQTGHWVISILLMLISRLSDRGTGKEAPNEVMLDLLRGALRFGVWTIVLIALLDNAGINITAFIASIGIGGIAIAFALQKILADLFASIVIGLDKPFKVGDRIDFNGKSATVQRVGIKSTRLISLSGEGLAVSNATLLDSVIHNYAVMRRKRVTFQFALPYGTSSADVQDVVTQVSQLIRDAETAIFDRGHCTKFTDSGFELEFCYFVMKADLAAYRDTHHHILMGITSILESKQLSFAVPIRDVHLQGAMEQTR